MATLADLIPDPNSVLALELEELAGVALELLTCEAVEMIILSSHLLKIVESRAIQGSP